MRWLIYKSHWYSKQIGWHRSTKKAHVWISIIFNSIFVFTSYIVTPILWITRNSELSSAYSVVLNFIFRIICKRQNKMLQTGSGNQAKGQVKGFLSRRLDLTSLPSTSLSNVFKSGGCGGLNQNILKSLWPLRIRPVWPCSPPSNVLPRNPLLLKGHPLRISGALNRRNRGPTTGLGGGTLPSLLGFGHCGARALCSPDDHEHDQGVAH